MGRKVTIQDIADETLLIARENVTIFVRLGPGEDLVADLLRLRGIVHRLRAVAAQVEIFHALLFQMLFDGFLQLEAAVVGTDCDHIYTLLCGIIDCV